MKLLRLKLLPALITAALAGSSVTMTGCNIFDPFDSPSGDDQLLSAARACFDKGDLACARDLYAKLSTDKADIANSETAFTILEEAGAGMGALMEAVGSGGGGGMINKLAGRLSIGSGEARRVQIYSAYKKVAVIGDPGLRGLVRFISALALAAEILAEDLGADSILQKTDLVSNATACTVAACATAGTACDKSGTASIISETGTTFNLVGNPTGATVTGAMSWAFFNSVVVAIEKALDASELGAGGKFSTGAGSFATQLTGAAAPTNQTNSRCYRATLVSAGVGVDP